LKLAGTGPRGLALAGGAAYVAERFGDSVGVVKLNGQAHHHPRSIALGPKREMSPVRRGEMLFSDATMCFQQWQSCVSCHPGVRSDGLNWDLLNDGFGNPKNSKSLLHSYRTPPAMITGVRAKAEVAVRAGMKFIQFAVRPEADAEAIDAYLKSLRPVPSPFLVEGRLSEAAQRGKKLFLSSGCGTCHSGKLFTDGDLHDIGTGRGREKGREFDTPTLVEVWRTAPYLLDGRAATIEDVLRSHNVDDRHGKTSTLSEEQIRELAAYVLSQ
jgi:cytochrome c peroxidase